MEFLSMYLKWVKQYLPCRTSLVSKYSLLMAGLGRLRVEAICHSSIKRQERRVSWANRFCLGSGCLVSVTITGDAHRRLLCYIHPHCPCYLPWGQCPHHTFLSFYQLFWPVAHLIVINQIHSDWLQFAIINRHSWFLLYFIRYRSVYFIYQWLGWLSSF